MVDETQQHIDKILKLMKAGKKRIGIFNNSGEGKTFLLAKLRKIIDTEPKYKEYRNFNIYYEDSMPISEPYVMPFVGLNCFDEDDDRPKPDAIYIPTYSKAYKDAVMGFEMPEGTTFRGYEEKQRKEKINSCVKKNFKSMSELVYYVNNK